MASGRTPRTAGVTAAKKAVRSTARAAALALTGAIQAAPAGAQDRWSLFGDLAAYSDRADRGLSLSDIDPTATVAGEAVYRLDGTAGELFGGAQAGYVQDLAGRDVQLTGYLGWVRQFGGAYDLSVTLYADSFHGDGSSRVYGEGRAAVARDFGLLYVRGGVGLAPDGRWSDPDGRTVYPFAEVQAPVPTKPWLTVLAGWGYSAIARGADRSDWFAGIAATKGDVELSLRYVDTGAETGPPARLGRARAVAALRWYF